MKLLPYNHDMYIEPTDPITTPGEFAHQLILHFTQEGKGVTLLEPGMEPVGEGVGGTDVGRLGAPHLAINPRRVPIRSGSLSHQGYQWMYLNRK